MGPSVGDKPAQPRSEPLKLYIAGCWLQAPLVASKGASPEETQHCTLHFAQAGQPESSRFDVARYYGSLDTTVLGRLVLAADAITSTQTIIQDNVAALPDGTLCIADKQIGGKGGAGEGWAQEVGAL